MKKLFLSIVVLLGAAGLCLGQENVSVTFYTPGIVRVVKAPAGQNLQAVRPESSFAVQMEQGKVAVRESKSAKGRNCSSSVLSVQVAADGTVSFYTAKGKLLVAENRYSFVERESGLDKGAWIAKQSWRLEDGEPMYGLGILQDGALSLRGKKRHMLQDNTEDFVPLIQSVKGYGIYWDNASPTNFADGPEGMSLESEVAKAIDYYFIYGGSADGVIAGMRELTGHVPMLPLWSYGFMQSRERYKSSRELLDALHGYRDRQVPIDCIIQDWQYWGNNYLWNAMEFLNDDFRNAQRMIDEVHNQNAHMMISIWASFGPMTKQYRELNEKGHLLHFETWPRSGLGDWPPRMEYPSGVLVYDPFSSEARDIYWKYLLGLENMHIDGWWMDSTEPDHHSFKDSDLEEMTAMGSYRSVLNAYPLMSVEGVAQKQREVSDRRAMILTRSAFAGQQRTGANTWSGDVQSTWDDFRHQISAGLGFNLTGNPNYNSDIGGFFPGGYNRGNATCSKNPLFQELYVRWLQFGVFNPMMRSHGESSRREIWEFGQKGEPIYDAIEKNIRFRYALLPYIYSTSWQVTSADGSFMRALMMDFASDKNTWNIGNEYMFGKSLLVAPVSKALFTTEERKFSTESVDWSTPATFDVYLPAGAKWYDFWTGELLNGGRTVAADAPIDRCPLYVRAGSIIPLGPDVQYASEKPWDDLEIRVYPGANGSFVLYEDEGDNHNYEKGEYSTIEFTLKGRTLTIGERSGAFSGMLQNRNFRIVDVSTGNTHNAAYSGSLLSIRL